jgi:LmbE family N-acetylglucosaminyl deacetylase
VLSTWNKALAAVTISALCWAAAPPTAASAAPVDALYLQVIAHQDDDLLFLNPDVDATIAAGRPSITVYLTAGQLTGDGATDAERARNRQRGVQNAYATMAGVADDDDTTQDEWTAIAWPVGGRTAELYVLDARPDVQLIFIGLHDGSLRNIDTGGTDSTVVAADGVVNGSSQYNRADLIQVLRLIMSTYRPTVLRTQDAEPDRRPGYTADHTDHIAAAKFAREAAAGYPRPLVEVTYRDYNIADSPVNLSAAQIARKTQVIGQYYRYDTAARDSHSGDNWLTRMYHRWPQGGGWVARDAGEAVQAFVVVNGRPYQYSQRIATFWLGTPLADPGGRLAPGLSVLRGGDGRLHVFGHRLSDHHLVTLSEDDPSWVDLGSPNAGLDNADQLGTPVVAANADGRLQLFVKNGGGGLSSIKQTTVGGAWSRTWLELGGTDLQDGLTAVTGSQGRIDVFGATRAVVLRWTQLRPNDPVTRDGAFASGVPVSPPQATLDRLGRITVAYRRAGTGTMSLITQVAAGGTTWQSPVDLGGPGTAAPAAVLSPAAPGSRIMLFARDPLTGVSTSRQGTTGAFGPWAALGGDTVDSPAAILDASSRATLFTVGSDGLSVAQQTAAGPDQPFGPWTEVGF